MDTGNKNAVNAGKSCRKRGLLLVNLGTPEKLEKASVRRFLAEFLADPRVVSLPRPFWLPVLFGLILPFRSGKTLRVYEQVWTADGSPLRVFSQQLCQTLAAELPGYRLALAMRYGSPSIASRLAEFRAAGISEVIVLPLYPQYSSTTTAAVFDAIAEYYRGQYAMPGLTFIRDYHQNPTWLAAVADSIRSWQGRHGRPDLLIFSYHGLPELLDRRGDPYRLQCEASTAAIARLLGLEKGVYRLCYQSRFGKAAWLKPYLETELQQLPAGGIRRIQVVSPGFAVDGIETLEEIAIRGHKTFLDAGGEWLQYIPALNAARHHAQALAGVVRDALGSG